MLEKQREAVAAEARSWIGTKFHFGAALKGVGVACGPFLLECHKVWHPDPSKLIYQTLAKDWHCHTQEERFLKQVQNFCHQVEEPCKGDLVLFRLGAKDRPYSHGGIIVEWPLIIHAYFRGGVGWVDASRDPLLSTCPAHSFWSPW